MTGLWPDNKEMRITMKKKGLLWIILVTVILFGRTEHSALAASGSTVVSVSSSSVNIGDKVKVTVKAQGPAGEKTVSTMTVSFDAAILEFVNCSATYGGGGNSVTATSDSFTVTLKAIAAGKSSIAVSGSDGVVFDTNEELDSMAKSSASVTVNNAAAEQPVDNNTIQTTPQKPKPDEQPTVPVQTTTTEEKKLSADNSLQSLVLSAGTLSPAFSGPVTKYTATVPNSVTSLAVTATPVNEKAVVESVSGNENLSVGVNNVSIVVRAENGVTATYTVQVTREAEGAPAETEPPAESEAAAEANESQAPDSETETILPQESDPTAAETQTAPTEETETEEVDVELLTANMEYMQKEYNTISELYEKLRRSRLIMIIIFLFVTVILVMIIINLLLRIYQKEDDNDEIETRRGKMRPRRQTEREPLAGDSQTGVSKRARAPRQEEQELTPEQRREQARREWFSDDLEERTPRRKRRRQSEQMPSEAVPKAGAADKEGNREEADTDFIDFNDM